MRSETWPESHEAHRGKVPSSQHFKHFSKDTELRQVNTYY